MNIAILRGINVGGHNKVKMTDLQTAMIEAGFTNVSTYIQSGNLFFSSASNDQAFLAGVIKKLIRDRFNIDVPVITRSQTEIRKVIDHNPFLEEPRLDKTKLHVTFLSEYPQTTGLQNINKESFLPDRFSIVEKQVYLYCPNGYGRTKLTNSFFESKLNVIATTRNWKTVLKLAQINE